jgi:hypothetical protein
MIKPVISKSLESTGFIGDHGWIQTSNLLSHIQVMFILKAKTTAP